MTHEEELELCLKMGVREDWAEELLSSLSGTNRSALPMLRLLRSLTDLMRYYEGRYAERLKKVLANGGTLSIPEENLIKRGATPEEIQDLAHYYVKDTICCVMTMLDCLYGEPELFKEEAFSECGSVGIMEFGPDRRPTGKHVDYPMGVEFERWFKKDE